MFFRIIFYLILFLSVKPLYAHTFTGMVGFYDGISHPVLGIDHFIAMVCVGIISSQIGGKAILKIPFVFVIFMLIGGAVGLFLESFAYSISGPIEYGIIFSVIFLGFSIAIEKKLSISIITISVAFFGIFHGLAHGIEIPWAANPLFFALGFSTGTASLHLFGVGIGLILIKNNLLNVILRLLGLISAFFGLYLLF